MRTHCPLCGVENLHHEVEVQTGRCENLAPSMGAFIEAWAERLGGGSQATLEIKLAHLTEFVDPDDVEQGPCPKCGGSRCYVKSPRSCDDCGWEER